jgi:hypothetical protein
MIQRNRSFTWQKNASPKSLLNGRNKPTRMLDLQKFALIWKLGLIAGSLSVLASCAQLIGPGGLLRDPANETQSAVATQAAAKATIPASPTPRPPSATPNPPPEPTVTATSSTLAMCAATDLLVNLRSDITGTAMVFTVALTNAGNGACILPQPPNASLVTKQGALLEVDSAPNCIECVPKALLVQSEPMPTAAVTPESGATQAAGSGQVTLSADKTATIIFRWTNWCNPLPPGGVAIRLEMGNGAPFDLATDAQKAGTCTASGQPSVLAISPYVISR